ncbi:MAG: hypothetical protein D6775_13815 [Caldilineae bacterium]|nr:MAG: hypothetical protein D6775_13815 [Caldilineae bacterium]
MASQPFLPLFPLLKGKMRPPPLPAQGVLARPRLYDRLDRALERVLTLLIAPAGYGKTTLLSTWLRQTQVRPVGDEQAAGAHAGPLAVWLSLDEEDGDPVLFLAYLAATLEPVVPQAARLAFELLGDSRPPFQAVLALLMRGLEELSVPLLLILDDVHHVQMAAEVLRLLGKLLQHAPPTLHFILAGRSEPELAAIPRLRAAGQVIEIDEGDLRFSEPEVRDLFARVFGDTPDPAILADWTRRTEGWITALQLLYRSGMWQTRPAQDWAQARTSAPLTQLYDYLARVVLEGQPRDVIGFLQETSILDPLRVPLCDAVRCRDDSAAMLAYLCEQSLFTFAAGSAPDEYRYHALFRAFLQRRLREQVGDEAVRALHRRAASWYLEQGEHEHAVAHLLQAQDYEAALDLIRSLWRALLSRGRFRLLERWLIRFPASYRETRPWLLLIRARLATLRGRRGEAEQLLYQAQELLRDQEDRDALYLVRLDLAALMAARHGNFAKAEALAREALSLAPTPSDRASALGYTARYHYMDRGATSEAEKLLAQAVDLARQVGPPLLLAELLQLQGLVHSSKGDLLTSQAIFEQVLRLLEGTGNRHRQLHTLQNAVYGYYLLGEFPQARTLLERARRLAQEFGRRDHLAYLLNLEGLLHMEAGRWEEAERCFSQALASQQSLGETYEIPVTLNFMAQLHRRRGRLAQAKRLAEEGLRRREDIGNQYEVGLSLIDLGAVYLEMEHTAEAEQIWQRALAIFERYQAHYEQTQLHYFLAVGALRRGDEATLARHLQEAMERAHLYEHGEPRRCLHFLLAEEEHTAGLMAAALERNLVPECVDCLLPRLGAQAAKALLSRLSHPRAQVRARAAYLLGQVGDVAAIKPLAAARQDADPAVAQAARQALAQLLAQTPPPLHVRCLGGFHLTRGQQEITRWERSAARKVLQLLLLHEGRAVPMEWLMERLWPEHTPRKARKNLHQAVASLRRTLEPELAPGLPSRYLQVEENTYRLLLPSGSTVDFRDFEQRLRALLAHPESAEVRTLEEALALYTGDFLPEEPYEEWALEIREHLHELYRKGMLTLARRYLAIGECQDVVSCAGRLLAMDACDEEAALLQMQALATQGEYTAARRVYLALRESLRRDLGVEPGEEVKAFLERLGSG